MANIHKGDLVQVISGPTQDRGGDRGKQGRVIEVFAEKNRVLVEGINYVTKHSRVGQTQRGTKTGGIETMESPIHISNVALVNPDTKLPARVGFKVETDDRGKTVRTRYFKDSRRADSKKAKALRGDDDKPKADKAVKADKATDDKAKAAKAPVDKADKPAKAEPKATKKDAEKATEKDAE